MGRYRIVAQVGRGGMGEVYRADDLRLGQTVALKFLPALRGRNPEDLAQLYREVRIARQISHPNVCRVFDIGDSEGMPFLTMEFVDGEDLASLMKRIGRLQPDKAIQLAQQLCAGLGEAHSFGVLHRDLKPANIMLDGRGNARIADFGLAIMAGEARGEDAWVGTPAYMSPEQLSGGRPTTQSDIYALGLVLYELFTGKNAYPGNSVSEILQQRRKGAPAKISGIVKGLDPAIERIILQCLERDPQSRPRTVLQITAALPGGDPLAATIAAGETPSPELVAAAPDQPLTSVGRLWLMAAALVAGLAIVGFSVQNTSVLGLAPLDRSPEAMAERVRQLLHRLGYVAPPADTAYWYEADSAYLRYRASRGGVRDVARQLSSAVPAPMRFIYRQSPRPLLAHSRIGSLSVTLTQPPDDLTGMLTMVLDGAGRLLSFSAVPPLLEPGGTAASPQDWTPLLAEAGLDEKALTPVPPKWLPMTRLDSRASWEGILGGEPVQVIAAAYRGKAVYFRIVAPWMPGEPQEAARTPLTEPGLVYFLLQNLVLLGALLLARKNMRLGRGDRKGAERVAIALLIATLAQWLFLARHVVDAAEFSNFQAAVAQSLYGAVYVYLAYLAVEPYVRRRWPNMLVSWTRTLTGRFADPRVGRDLLAGCLAGVFLGVVVASIATALTTWFQVSGAPSYPWGNDYAIRGWAGAFGVVAYCLLLALIYALAAVVVLLLAQFVGRRKWLTVSLFIIISSAGSASWLGVSPIIAIPAGLAISAACIFVLFRFGILGLSATYFTSLLISYGLPTVDASRWYFRSSALVLVILAALAIHGFRAALAGRPMFGRAILED
jgi:serine/threonine-protein kinase